MYQYRVTKYDPKYRDASGAFQREDWVAVSDIGRVVDGAVLTLQRYIAIENAYVESAIAFMTEAGVDSLTIGGLENSRHYRNTDLSLVDGHACSLLEIADIARLVLRERFWCRLANDYAFLHIGRDYYMYIGVPRKCPQAIELATRAGLFVEPFESPYLKS